MKIKKTVYKKSFEEAKTNGELDRYHESYKLNEDCCASIARAINDSNYEPNHYDLKHAAERVLHTYGNKRVLWVLAATVQQNLHDGRYSSTNKDWASTFHIPMLGGRYPTVNSHPVLVNSYIGYVKDIIAEQQQAIAVKRATKSDGLTAFAAEEKDLFYASESNPERDERLGYIGRLRGDFGSNGNEFWTTWLGGHADLKTKDFSAAFDNVVNELRSGVLKDYKSMATYCRSHPQAMLSESRQHYGFKLKTDKHICCLNLCAVRGDYNFYVYVFDRDRLERHHAEPKPSLLGKLEENKQKAADQPKPDHKKAKDLEV